MEKTKISKIILIAIIWILVNFGLLLLTDRLTDSWLKQRGLDYCQCQNDQYLPTDYCWGVCEYY